MFYESKNLELKLRYTEDIKKEIVAFANTDGGKLIIGVADDGSVKGVADPDDVLLRVTNTIRDSIRPDITLFIEADIEKQEEKPVVTVRVQRGTERPYYLTGKGIRPEGVFVRQGTSSVPATETAILKMIRETSGDCYEDARSLNQQLTFQKAADYFAKKGIAFSEAQKKTLSLIGEDGMYTNTALLLSDQCVHTIKLAVFEGAQKAVFKERREFGGSLLVQLEEAYAFMDRFNRTRAEFHGLDRIDQRDYPPEAIREALLNAVVHRDYSFSASTLISIFDDRLEFVSIGGLVRGITLRDIMLGVSVLRNEHLSNVFYRLRLIEAYGTGMPKIMQAYQAVLVKPQIEVTDHAFKITLPNINSKPVAAQQRQPESLTNREERVLEMLKNKEFIIRKDVETTENVSQATAIVLLRKMVDRGLLQKEGAGKQVLYRLAK